MGCFCYMQHTHFLTAWEGSNDHSKSIWEYYFTAKFPKMIWIFLTWWKTLPSGTPTWITPNKQQLRIIGTLWHVCLRNRCKSSFKMMLAAVTPPQQQGHALRFHTDYVRNNESRGHLSCPWVALSLQWTGNVSCDIWTHHVELLAPSERTQDLSPLLSQHPLMPHQAGLVSLLQASCDMQPVQGRQTDILPWVRLC